MEPFTFKRNGQEFDFTPLIGMTEVDVLKLVPEYSGKEVPPKEWTAEQVATVFKAADLKAWAKELGIKAVGKELEVAKRLLDAGFDFNKRGIK